MGKSYTIKAPAKVNLFLDVLGVRDDGYHDIHTIMQSIDLCDVVSVKVSDRLDSGRVISVGCDDVSLPCDETNLAYRAAAAFFAFMDVKIAEKCAATVDIFIEKNIPVAAGLGGGSADAAAVLILLNRAFGDALTLPELYGIGGKIGADVPFCVHSGLYGGAMAASGIGDVFVECPPLSSDSVILVAAFDIPVLTPWAYGEIDRLRAVCGEDGRNGFADIQSVVSAFSDCDDAGIASLLFNSFEAAVIGLHPVIGDVKRECEQCGAYASLMSGSGASVFALFENESDARSAAASVQAKFADVKRVFVCRPYAVR